MLKILYFTDGFDGKEKKTATFLSDLYKSHKVQVIICTNNLSDNSCSELIGKYFAKDTTVISYEKLFESSRLFDEEDIIMPLFSGEVFNFKYVKKALSFYDDFTCCVLSPAAEESETVDLEENKDIFASLCHNLCLIKYSLINKEIFADFDLSCPDECRALILSYACLKTNKLNIFKAGKGVTSANSRPQNLSWYSEKFFARYENLGKYCLKTKEQVPYFIQYLICYQLLRRFNLNRSKKCICPEMCMPENREEFFFKCTRILKFVDNRVFMRLDGTDYIRFPEPGIALISSLKKGETDLSVKFQPMKTHNNLFCCVDDCIITSVKSKSATIRKIKVDGDGNVHLTVFTNGVFEYMGCQLQAFCDGEKAKVSIEDEETLAFFGAPIFKREVYNVSIPTNSLYRKSQITFSYKYKINEYRLSVDHTSAPKICDLDVEFSPSEIIITDESLPVLEIADFHKEGTGEDLSCLVVISEDGDSPNAFEAVNHIISENDFYQKDKLHFAIVTKNEADYSDLSKLKNIYFYNEDDFTDLDKLRQVLKIHRCDFVTHLSSRDKTDAHYFDDALSYASEYEVSAIAPYVSTDETYIGFKNVCTDLHLNPHLTPSNYCGIFYKTQLFFESEVTTEFWKDAMSVPFSDEKDIAVFLLLTKSNKNILLLEQHCIIPFAPVALSSKSYGFASEPEWYFPSVKNFFLWAENLYPDDIPVTVQYTLMGRLHLRLKYNENTHNTHLISPEVLPQWKNSIKQICQRIDDEVIADIYLCKSFHIQPHIASWLLQIKHGENYTECVTASPKNLFFKSSDCQILLLSNQSVMIEMMDYDSENVILECSAAGFFEKYNIFPQAKIDDKIIPTENSYHYAHRKLFGETFWKRHTFRVKLPFSELSAGNLSFVYSLYGYEYPIKISTGRYTAKLNKTVPGSYWICKNFIFSFSDDFSQIIIEPYSETSAKEKEKNLRKLSLDFAPYSERETIAKLMKIRKKYFSSRSRYKNKNIWLTFDKLYKAGDNADYFYRYAVKQNDGVDIHYVINKGYPDAKKFIKDKLKPLYFTSTKHILHFLNSRIIATTHAGLPVFSGIAPANFKYVQDLFNADVVCIQHGLAVQWMPHNLYASYDNTKRFYCATQSELNNLGKAEYGYDKKALRLTGLARYDGLVNDSKRQILISPTWRSYIAMPSNAGNTRPYSETFKETEYYRIYNNLVKNPKLAETAERYNYHIVYLLHPTLSNQIEDFTPAKNIEVCSPVGESYEKMMTQSDLMITDFSGIQFDFAYMRKPIVYYHPDELPAGYEEGGFSYSEQAFGPICKDETSLVDTVCKYMENECQLDDFYRQRQNTFFTFDDHNNCKRIYDELLEFSKKQAGENRETIGFGFTCIPTLKKKETSFTDENILEWSLCENCSQYEILCSEERNGIYRKITEVSSESNFYKVPAEYKDCFFKIRGLFGSEEYKGDCSNIIRF